MLIATPSAKPYNAKNTGTGWGQDDIFSLLSYTNPSTGITTPMNLAGNGGPGLVGAVFLDPVTNAFIDHSADLDNYSIAVTFAANGQSATAVLTWPNGLLTITVVYTVHDSQLDITVAVASSLKVVGKSIRLFGNLPLPNIRVDGATPNTADLTIPGVTATVVSGDPGSTYNFGIFAGMLVVWEGNLPYDNNQSYNRLNNPNQWLPQYPFVPAGQPNQYSPITTGIVPNPRVNTTFSVSIRFGPPNTPVADLIPDYIAAYRAAHPFTLPGPAPRFACATWLADWGELAGLTGQAYQTAILARAATCVTNMLAVGAETIYFWDLEGYPPTGGYVGTPSLITTLNPALGWRSSPSALTTLELLVKAFRNAGLRCGLTIRGQLYTSAGYVELPGPDPNQTYIAGAQLPPSCQHIVDQANAAIAMGFTRAYVDSADKLFQLDDGSYWAETCARLPGFVLSPEGAPSRCYRNSRPYVEIRGGQFGVGQTDVVRAIWENSAALVWCGDAGPTESLTLSPDAIETALNSGNTVMFKPYDPAQVAAVMVLR